jgi:hypothetical protein
MFLGLRCLPVLRVEGRFKNSYLLFAGLAVRFD